MCEPVSMAICAVVCCCACVFVLFALAQVVPIVIDVINLSVGVQMCVDETLGEPLATTAENENCQKAAEMGCDKLQEEKSKRDLEKLMEEHGSDSDDIAIYHSRRLAEHQDTSNIPDDELETLLQQCQELTGKCMCSIAERLSNLEPPFDDRLNKCCVQHGEDAENSLFGEIAGEAEKVCHDLVENVTQSIHTMKESCAKGFPNVADLNLNFGAGGGPVPEEFNSFTQQFSVIDDIWKPSTPNVNAAAALGGGVVLLAGAALVFRRKTRAATSGIVDNAYSARGAHNFDIE